MIAITHYFRNQLKNPRIGVNHKNCSLVASSRRLWTFFHSCQLSIPERGLAGRQVKKTALGWREHLYWRFYKGGGSFGPGTARACVSFECLLTQSPAQKCFALCSNIQRPRSLIAISREDTTTRTGSRRPVSASGARRSFATQHGLPGRSTFLHTVVNGRKQSRFNPFGNSGSG